MRFFFFLILFFIGQICFGNNPKTCSVVQGDVVSPLGAKDIFRWAQVRYAKSDMTDFCRRNLIMRYLNSQDFPPEKCARLTLAELEKLADEKSLNNNTAPWNRVLISTRKSRFAAFSGSGLTFPDFNDPSSPKTQAELSSITADMNKKLAEKSLLFKAKRSEKLAACLVTEPTNIAKCRKAIDFIITNAIESEDGRLQTPDAWRAIYGSNKYNEGLRLAALKLQTNIKKNSFDPKENIFDVLADSFKKSGLSNSEAVEATWNSLGAIANGGPNTDWRAETIEKSQKSKALAYIAIAMPALDYLKQSKGYPLFSYPSEIKTSCDSAKPYHFWMSAYLSRKMVKDGVTDRDLATSMTFLSEKAYQLKKDSTILTRS